MPIPRFTTLREDIDPKLDAIIHRALQRDRDKRYQTAFEMLHDLEVYLYSDRYGPTNEKLGVYLRELFGVAEPLSPPPAASPTIAAHCPEITLQQPTLPSRS
jgi:serine/threonine-protein kinase